MNRPTWIRVRGVGRERLARYASEFLVASGFEVRTVEETEGPVAVHRLSARLSKTSPSVPLSLSEIILVFSPAAGGSEVRWESPHDLRSEDDRPRALRFVTEFLSFLERLVATETRATGKVTRQTADGTPFFEISPPATPPGDGSPPPRV